MSFERLKKAGITNIRFKIENIQASFANNYGHTVTKNEMLDIIEFWKKIFLKNQNNNNNNCSCCCNCFQWLKCCNNCC